MSLTSFVRSIWGETEIQWNQRFSSNWDYGHATRIGTWIMTAIGIARFGQKPGHPTASYWIWQIPTGQARIYKRWPFLNMAFKNIIFSLKTRYHRKYETYQ